ncbi:MAG: DUF2953 domain-containing protein [Ruminococcaceae bacterium]|nr:DUF2953 domain-containing protein [Oscillospiraceae bacterium]
MLLWVVLGGVVIKLLLLLIIPMELGVDYVFSGKAQSLRITTRILGIPLSLPISLDKKKKEKNKKEKAEQTSVTVQGFVHGVKKLYHEYTASKEKRHSLWNQIKRHVTCKRCTLSVAYGTGNPATTGMLNGAVWTAGSLLMKLIDSVFPIQEESLSVEPDFVQSCLRLHSKLIISFRAFRLLQIVYGMIRLVKEIKNNITTEEGRC